MKVVVEGERCWKTKEEEEEERHWKTEGEEEVVV